ncbi:hypothetical protein OC835_001464 [Tilletia horrida]|nr:hypothetical protein OC835_001464 [Tilletia horrida]
MAPRSTLYSVTFDVAEIHFYHLVGMAMFRTLPFSDIEFDTARTYIRQSAPADRFRVWDSLLTEIKNRSSISSKASRLPPRPFFPVHQACQALVADPSRYSFDMELKELYLTVAPELHLPTEDPVAGLRIASMVDEDDAESSEEEDESEEGGSGSESEDHEDGEDDDTGPPVRLNAHFRQYAAHRPPLSQILGMQKARPGTGQARPGRAPMSSAHTRASATQEQREPGRDEDARAGPSTQAIAVGEAGEGRASTGSRPFPAVQPAAVRTSTDAGGTGDITPQLLNTGGERVIPPFAPVQPSAPSSEGPMDVDVASARARALERQRQLPGQTGSSLLAPIEEIIRRLESCPVLNYFDLWSRRPVRAKQTELLEWLCRCCKTGYQTKIGPDKKLVTASLVTHLYHCRNRMAPDAAGLLPWTKVRKERVRKGRKRREQGPVRSAEGGDAAATTKSSPSTSRRVDERRHLRRAYLCWTIRHGIPLSPSTDEEAGPLMGLLDEEAAPPHVKELEDLRDDILSDVQASIGQSPGRFTLVFSVNGDAHSRLLWLCVHAAWVDPHLRPRNACIMVQPIEWIRQQLAQSIAKAILDRLGRLGLTGKWSGFVVAPPTRINAHVFHQLGLERLKTARGLTDEGVWLYRRWGEKELRFVPCFLSMVEHILAAHGLGPVLRARDACGEGGILPTATEAANQSERSTPAALRNQELEEADVALWLLEREKSIQLPFSGDGLYDPPRGTFSLAALQDALHLSSDMPNDLARSTLETVDAIIADAREGSTVAADWSMLTDLLAATVGASSSDGGDGTTASLIEAIGKLDVVKIANPVVAAASYLRTDVSLAAEDSEKAESQFASLHGKLSSQLDIMTPDTGPGHSASERVLLQLRGNSRTEPAGPERVSPARRRRADSDGRGAAAVQRRRVHESAGDDVRRYGREGLAWRRETSANASLASMPSLALQVWALRRAAYPSLAQSAATLLAVPISADIIDQTRSELGRMNRSQRGLSAQFVGVATVTKMLLLAGFSTKRD